MASKATVTAVLAGDEKKAVEAFDKVGAAAKQMGDKVDSASGDFDKTSRSAEDFAEKSDTVDTRAMGFRDTITGLQDSFKGLTDSSLPLGERLLTLGMGVGDLASGFTNLLIPAISSAWKRITQTTIATRIATVAQTVWATVTKALAAAMRVLNAVMRANPIMFIVGLIALLVGAFIALWNKSAGFRNFFIGVWNTIRAVVGGVVNAIKGMWNGLVNAARTVASKIGGFFSGIGNAIKSAFKSAINFVIDLINGAIGFINTLIDGANLIPGVSIPHIPQIPRMHTGGIVPGMPGTEVPIMAMAGERVSTSGQAGGNLTLRVAPGADSKVGELINYLIRMRIIDPVWED